MNVHLSNAVRMFYSKSSFEMVYMEAIANALDAEATEIGISIVANSKDFLALIGDAEKRNATFLSLIQNTFNESRQEQQIVEGA